MTSGAVRPLCAGRDHARSIESYSAYADKPFFRLGIRAQPTRLVSVWRKSQDSIAPFSTAASICSALGWKPKRTSAAVKWWLLTQHTLARPARRVDSQVKKIVRHRPILSVSSAGTLTMRTSTRLRTFCIGRFVLVHSRDVFNFKNLLTFTVNRVIVPSMFILTLIGHMMQNVEFVNTLSASEAFVLQPTISAGR